MKSIKEIIILIIRIIIYILIIHIGFSRLVLLFKGKADFQTAFIGIFFTLLAISPILYFLNSYITEIIEERKYEKEKELSKIIETKRTLRRILNHIEKDNKINYKILKDSINYAILSNLEIDIDNEFKILKKLNNKLNNINKDNRLLTNKFLKQINKYNSNLRDSPNKNTELTFLKHDILETINIFKERMEESNA